MSRVVKTSDHSGPFSGPTNGPAISLSEILAPSGRHPALRSANASGNRRMRWVIGGIAALLILAWLMAILLFEHMRFVIFTASGKPGFEVFLALGQLFGALVLALSSDEPTWARMKWVASGLLVFSLGALGFGYFYGLMVASPDITFTVYGSIMVRSLATILIAAGLLPENPLPLKRRHALGLVGTVSILGAALVLLREHLPTLVHLADPSGNSALSDTGMYPGLTAWHFGLASVPMIAGLAAAWGAVRHYQGQVFDGWLLVAVIFCAGAQLHSLFWPSMYSSAFTTTTFLRFGFTTVIISGAILELRSQSVERAWLLANEQARVKDLEALGILKRDFSSIVAHELATPLAAIGNLAEMISVGAGTATQQQHAASRIERETRILQRLVRDIQESADVERDDFTVRLQAVPVESLLRDADAYAKTTQHHHPLVTTSPAGLTVSADPERIGQVIRNLLNNASRHTPPGTLVNLRAVPTTSGVRIEVEDSGPGISPSELSLIMEKFGRGHHAGSEGRGLGLYLSRRILQAHGTDLVVHSEPGHGARFSFVLKGNL